MGSVAVFALVGFAAIITGAHLYQVRKSTERLALFALGTSVAGAAIGWLALPIAGLGGYLSVVLVLVCVAAGRLAPEYLFGVGVGFAVFGLPASRIALVVLSVAVGYATQVLEDSDWWRHRKFERSYNHALKRRLDAGGAGDDRLRLLLPPTWMVRAQLPVWLAVGTVPLVVGVLAGGGPWVAAAGLLVTASFVSKAWSLRGLTRSFRGIAVASMLLRAAIILLVAASPIGAWVARAASGSLPATPVWPLLVALAVLWAGLATAGHGPPEGRVIRPKNRSILLLLGIVSVLLDYGLFAFLAGGVYHRQAVLLAIGALLAGGQVLLEVSTLLVGDRTGLSANRVVLLNGLWVPPSDDHKLLAELLGPGAGSEGFEEDLEGWLYDSVLARPRRPDLALLAGIVNDASRAPHGTADLMHDVYGSGRQSLRVADALRWLNFASYVADIIEKDILPRWQAADVDRFRPELARLRATCAGGRANLYLYKDLREEAASAQQQAVEISDEAGLTNLAALMRVALAHILGMRLRRPAEAIALLETVLDDVRVASVIRRRGCLIAMMISRAFGDEAAFAAYRRRRDLLAASRRDYYAAVTDERLRVPALARWKTARMMATGFGSQELMVDAASPEGTEPLPLPKGGFPVPERELLQAGRLLAARGKTRRALSKLEHAARLAERQGHTGYLLRSRNAIAVIHLERGDRAAAWRNLSAAIDAQQHIRTLMIDPEVRGDVGGLYAETFERAIDLLVSGGPRPGEEWPSHPAATAFELSERARSRVFLELLGERLGANSRKERAARAALDSARQRLADSPAAEQEKRLGDVRDAVRALDLLYERRRAGNPRAAEYVALRRGTPTSYEQIRRLLTHG